MINEKDYKYRNYMCLNKLSRSIFWFLFKSDLIGVTAFSLAAVACLDGQSGVTFSADFLVTISLLGDGCNGGVHGSTSKSQN